MKVRVNNKKVLIVMLIILLLILAVGYAVFSETLTISGTANAKGTFDLEFQNAEIVKNIGADKEKTTAEISENKNTLTVNVGDLAYPGAGVEFSVDIVNVGTMPAEVQAVTPNNITGSDKIKVTGLEGIKVGHPKIEVGDRCNIHFTVEWPLDSGEISEAESTISFGLQIEYTQSTGEAFGGQASHRDTDKEGNTVTGDKIEEPVYEPLVDQITAEDYGKSINYIATVKEQKVSNWKVLYNDKSNIYLILNDFLPISLVPESTSLVTGGTHRLYSNTSRDALINGLITEDYWNEFANGAAGASAFGAPTLEMIMISYNEKYGKDITIGDKLDATDNLYVLPENDATMYWTTSPSTSYSDRVMVVNKEGFLTTGKYSEWGFTGTRPVVKLPGTVTGTVGETIEIK